MVVLCRLQLVRSSKDLFELSTRRAKNPTLGFHLSIFILMLHSVSCSQFPIRLEMPSPTDTHSIIEYCILLQHTETTATIPLHVFSLFGIISHQCIKECTGKIAMMSSAQTYYTSELSSHRRIWQWTHQNYRTAVSRLPNLIRPCFRKNTREKSWRWRKGRGHDQLSWHPIWAAVYSLF